MLHKKHKLSHENVRDNVAHETVKGKEHLSLKVVEDDTTKKFAVVVPRRITKKAIERNRLRRVLYSEIEKNIENIKVGTYLVLVKKKPNNEDVIRKELKKLLGIE